MGRVPPFRLRRVFVVGLVALVIAAGLAMLAAPNSARAQGGDLDCIDYSSGDAAQGASKNGDPNNLDADGDGQACEWNGSQESGWFWGSLLGGAIGFLAVALWVFGGLKPISFFAAALYACIAFPVGFFAQAPVQKVVPPRLSPVLLFVIPFAITALIGAGIGIGTLRTEVKKRRTSGRFVPSD